MTRCQGKSPALTGQLTVVEALDRLLADADCRYQMVDPTTVRIFLPPPPRSMRSPKEEPIRAGHAAAAPVALSRPPQLEIADVVVTATKRAAAFAHLPDSVSVISPDQLAVTGADDSIGAARLAAGVTMTNLGPGRDKILVRGLSDGAFTGRTQSTVGTYLDNIPITYNAPDPDLRLIDVENVEIIKGPQGALYGGGSLAGVYRIVPRKPELDRLSGSLSGQTGWTESGSPSDELDAVLNAPIVHGRMAVRLVAFTDIDGGYLDDVNLRLSNVDRTVRWGGRVGVQTRLSDNWSVNLAATVRHLDTADTQYTTPTSAAGRFRRANRVRETHNDNLGVGSIVLAGSGEWGRLESSIAYVREGYSSLYDATAALSAFGVDGDDLGVYEDRVTARRMVQDTVLTSPSTGPFTWLVGAFASMTLQQSPSRLTSSNGAEPLFLRYEDRRKDRQTESAVYGEGSLAFGGGWTVSVGARVFKTWLRTYSYVMAPPPGQSRVLNKDGEFGGVSPKVSLQYDFAGGDLLYLLASEGYRSGGFNSSGVQPPPPSRATFSPDHLRNFECGAKLRLLNGALRLRTALYYDVWTDIQTDQYLGSGISYTANVGDGRAIGLESEIDWRITPSFSLEANSLFASPKVTRVNPAFAARTGKGLPGVPDASFALLGVYDRPFVWRTTLLLSAQATYVGRSRLTFDPVLSPPMGGYVTADLSAQLKRDRWRLAAYLSNPFNATGDTFAYGNPFSFGQVRQVTPQRPRTLSLRLSTDF